MSLLLSSTIKVSVIVLVALIAVAALRKRSASVRHWLLAAAIVCAAAAPLLEAVVPAWDLRRAHTSGGEIALGETLYQGSYSPRRTDCALERAEQGQIRSSQRLERSLRARGTA